MLVKKAVIIENTWFSRVNFFGFVCQLCCYSNYDRYGNRHCRFSRKDICVRIPSSKHYSFLPDANKKKYKFTKRYRFKRVLKDTLYIKKCTKCKYYHRNRNGGKTLCISPGYEELGSICSGFYNTEFYYAYIPM